VQDPVDLPCRLFVHEFACDVPGRQARYLPRLIQALLPLLSGTKSEICVFRYLTKPGVHTAFAPEALQVFHRLEEGLLGDLLCDTRVARQCQDIFINGPEIFGINFFNVMYHSKIPLFTYMTSDDPIYYTILWTNSQHSVKHP